MAMIPNRKKSIVGAKYRACSWRSIINGKPEIVGYGLEEKKIGQSRYALVAWHDDAVPFATRAEARNKAKQLNEQASAAAQKGKHDHRPNHSPTNPRPGAARAKQADALDAESWVSESDSKPLEADGEVFVRFSDGTFGTGWAAYWHGASNDFAQWCHPDPDEDRTVTHWMKPPTIDAAIAAAKENK